MKIQLLVLLFLIPTYIFSAHQTALARLQLLTRHQMSEQPMKSDSSNDIFLRLLPAHILPSDINGPVDVTGNRLVHIAAGQDDVNALEVLQTLGADLTRLNDSGYALYI